MKRLKSDGYNKVRRVVCMSQKEVLPIFVKNSIQIDSIFQPFDGFQKMTSMPLLRSLVLSQVLIVGATLAFFIPFRFTFVEMSFAYIYPYRYFSRNNHRFPVIFYKFLGVFSHLLSWENKMITQLKHTFIFYFKFVH